MISLNKIMQMLFSTVLLCSLVISCDVAEDESDCFAGVELSFKYLKDDSQDYFETDLSSLSVFVFDANNRFVERWDEYNSALFDREYKMEITLPPGVYSFIVWGGLNSTDYVVSDGGSATKTTSQGEPLMDEFSLKLNYTKKNYHGVESNIVDRRLEPLFYGAIREVECSYREVNSHTVELMQDSKRINLTVIGLPPSLARDGVGLYPHMDVDLSAFNGSCNFWNDVEYGGERITYLQQDVSTDQESNHTSKLYSMRMRYGSEHKLTIYNKDRDRVFYSADLLEDFIKKVPKYTTQEAIDAKDEFNIIIDVRTPLAVEVTVDGWYVGVSGSVIQ